MPAGLANPISPRLDTQVGCFRPAMSDCRTSEMSKVPWTYFWVERVNAVARPRGN